MSRCRESAGFLFDHPCSNVATSQCSKCSKPICSEHARGGACIACCREGKVKVADKEHDPLLMSSTYYPDYQTVSRYDAYSLHDRQAFQSSTEGPEEEWDKDWDTDFDGT
jgi:hypothetical protein